MKGIIFTEFLYLVENKFGYEMVDRIIRDSDLPNAGGYTSIGTYPFHEMQALIHNLHQRTNIPIPDLLQLYGRYFFTVLNKSYGHFFHAVEDAFELLEQINSHIHVEVRKLYPDAELPYFETRRLDEHTLEMLYQSERRLADFAEGLIGATMEHYGKIAAITRENLKSDGSSVRFLIQKQAL